MLARKRVKLAPRKIRNKHAVRRLAREREKNSQLKRAREWEQEQLRRVRVKKKHCDTVINSNCASAQ